MVVVNLKKEPETGFCRILVPIKDLSSNAREQFELALRLQSSASEASGTRITLLHIHDPRFNRHDRSWMHDELLSWSARDDAQALDLRIELCEGPGIDRIIHRQSRDHDLVILRSQRRRVAGLPIPASDRTSNLVNQLSCDSLVISDPLL